MEKAFKLLLVFLLAPICSFSQQNNTSLSDSALHALQSRYESNEYLLNSISGKVFNEENKAWKIPGFVKNYINKRYKIRLNFKKSYAPMAVFHILHRNVSVFDFMATSIDKEVVIVSFMHTNIGRHNHLFLIKTSNKKVVEFKSYTGGNRLKTVQELRYLLRIEECYQVNLISYDEDVKFL